VQDCQCTHIVKVDDTEHHNGLELLEEKGQGPGPEESGTQHCHLFVKSNYKCYQRLSLSYLGMKLAKR
jgi:hypothetical protein